MTGEWRSTQRRPSRPIPNEVDKLRRRLRDIAETSPLALDDRAQHPSPWGWTINRKRTQRLWRSEGLKRPRSPSASAADPRAAGVCSGRSAQPCLGARLPVRREAVARMPCRSGRGRRSDGSSFALPRRCGAARPRGWLEAAPAASPGLVTRCAARRDRPGAESP